jgi:hypothetical protein
MSPRPQTSTSRVGASMKILNAAAVIGPNYGWNLNRKVAAMATANLSLMLCRHLHQSVAPSSSRGISGSRLHIEGKSFRSYNTMAISFDPATMLCNCPTASKVLRRRGKPNSDTKGRDFIQADHCFSPAVPTMDHSSGDCALIMRIDHGDLKDLKDLFLSLINVYNIPRDSMILITSASHLAICGLDG